MGRRAFTIYRITQMKDPMAPTKAEKETLFYKLFGTSKREWDMDIKRQQQKQSTKQRDYFLSFRQHSKDKK